MRDYITLGCCPTSEDCAQVGSEDYSHRSIVECTAFINQLRRQFGDEVGSAWLKIMTFQHDFGSYREVVCTYEEDDKEGIDYAFKLEANLPKYWDKESCNEI